MTIQSDGSANAPTGAPQYSTLLSSYAAQPPWQVAGVDYAVGPQPGVALKDPTTINMPGVSLVTSGANHWIYITGNNVTLNGYDFTLDGGWTLVIEGQNDTISNFKIGVVSGSASPPIQMPSGSGANNTTIEYGTIDGGGAASSNLAGGCGIVDNSGLLTLQHSWIKNFTEGGVALGTTTSSLIQYNLFDSAKFDDNFHSQFINAPQGASNTVVQYNTFYQPAAASDGFPGFMVAALNDAGYANNANISGVVFNNNVGVGIGATGHVAGSPTDSSDAMEDWVNFTNSQNGTALNINPIAEDNYVTMSGTLHGFAYPLNGTVVTPTLANNVNMETGAQLTSVNVPSPPTVATTSTGSSGGTSTGSSGATSAKSSGGTSTGSSGATSAKSSGGTSTGSSGATSAESSGATSAGSSGATPTPPTISSFSPESGKASGGYTTAHVLTVTGVAAANSKVEVFNGSAQLGATTTNGKGAWSFTTPSLSNGAQSFNAKDVNSAGKVGAASRALNVTVVTNASLTKVGNKYNVTTAVSDPVLKYRGVNVTAGEFGTWMPIGAIQTASGYDVAWKNTSTGQYTVWTTDSNGNYTGNLIGAVSGNSYASVPIAAFFPQNVNGGGGVIGPTTKVIQTDGATSLTEVANHYYDLDGSNGSRLTLKYQGRNVTAGEFGKWTPIGAVKTASGYDVAWRNTGTGQYTVWSTGSHGNYKGNLTGGAVSGTSHALESLEPIFRQDLNHDGVIGPAQKLIQIDGSTRLTEVANHYYDLDGSSGSDPALKYKGGNVTVGEFGKWTPIGAIQIAGGYDVAWKNTGTGQYTVWSTDSNGNYKGNLTGGAVSGTRYPLESLEPIFRQDLNRDGVIGLYARPGTTLQISKTLAGTSGSATVGSGATLELTAADSTSVTFTGSTGTLRLDHSSTFTGKIFKFTGNGSLSGSDHIDLRDVKYSSVHDSYSNGVLTVTDGSGDRAKLSFNGSYTLANFRFANDGSGGTIVYDPPVTASSGQNTAAPKPVEASATTGTGETLDPVALPDVAFNVQSTLGYLPDSNQPGGIRSLAEGLHNANIALLGSYMASSFAAVSHSHGTITPLAEVAQSQSVLSSPHHA